MTITIECEQVADGRWLAEVPQLPGVQVYGATRTMATQLVLTLAYRVAAELELNGLEAPNAVDAFGRESERAMRATGTNDVTS